MIDPTMESLWLAIGADPDEAMNYLAMADRLEELGRTGEAARARWLGDNGKRPYSTGQGTWHWYEVDPSSDDWSEAADLKSDLPPKVYQRLTGGHSYGLTEAGCFRVYNSVREAVGDAILGCL